MEVKKVTPKYYLSHNYDYLLGIFSFGKKKHFGGNGLPYQSELQEENPVAYPLSPIHCSMSLSLQINPRYGHNRRKS